MTMSGEDAPEAGPATLPQRASGAVLSYHLRLTPSVVKADLLALLAAEFRRLHARCVERLFAHVWAQGGRLTLKGLSQAGEGEFAHRAMHRAFNDLKRTMKACRATGREFVLPYLRAELIAAAEIQAPRKATTADYWVHVEGLARHCQLYLPAQSHRALNRTLARAGARLATAAEIVRIDGQWYACVFVHVPTPAPYEPTSYLGCGAVRAGGDEPCPLSVPRPPMRSS